MKLAVYIIMAVAMAFVALACVAMACALTVILAGRDLVMRVIGRFEGMR